MRTLVCIPCMDTVHTLFFRSVLMLRPVGEVQYTMSIASLVYDGRNQLAEKAVREGFDRVLWLDSDMMFEPDLLERLSARLDEGREFVSGLYVSRKAPIRPVVYNYIGMRDGIPTAQDYADYPREQIFEIEGCGFGAVLMTADLINRVHEKFGLPFCPIPGFGEDLAFCLRARELGVKMYCDSTIKLGHIGASMFTVDMLEG